MKGDRAGASVLVRVGPEETFRLFTEEIDRWWRGGLKYRVAEGRSVMHLEPKLGGRLFEAFGEGEAAKVIETGRVTTWEPPTRLVLEWRAVNFAPSEKTEVEVRFEPSPSGTLVTVVHSGWAALREDHPVRHGQLPPEFLGRMGRWWGELLSALRETAEGGSSR